MSGCRKFPFISVLRLKVKIKNINYIIETTTTNCLQLKLGQQFILHISNMFSFRGSLNG